MTVKQGTFEPSFYDFTKTRVGNHTDVQLRDFKNLLPPDVTPKSVPLFVSYSTHICTYIRTYTHVHKDTHVRTRTHRQRHTRIHIYTHLHVRTLVRILRQRHTRVHTEEVRKDSGNFINEYASQNKMKKNSRTKIQTANGKYSGYYVTVSSGTIGVLFTTTSLMTFGPQTLFILISFGR